eukprot:14657470-Alexandrium_andersonii.AAC.1
MGMRITPFASCESLSSLGDGADRPSLTFHPLLGQPSTGGAGGCLLRHQPEVSPVAPACGARVSMHGA